MAVKIKLKRLGKIRQPQYRIVVADSRTKRDGRAIEEIGVYHPMEEPSLIKVASDRAQYWLGVGAQPTEAVVAILKVTGDWQRFKGLPGAEGTLQVAAAKPTKAAVFEAAAKDAMNEPGAKPKALAPETPVARAEKSDLDAGLAQEAAETAAVAQAEAATAAAEVDVAGVAAAEDAAQEAAKDAAAAESPGA